MDATQITGVVDAGAVTAAAAPVTPVPGAADTSQQAVPQAEPQEQWIELETGSRYRDLNALIVGATEKDRHIERLTRELAQFRVVPSQPQAPQQPQVGERESFIAETKEFWVRNGVDETFAQQQAEREWRNHERAVRQAEQRVQSLQLEAHKAEYTQIAAEDPRFRFSPENPFSEMIRGIASANRGLSPRQHYQIFTQRLQQLGIGGNGQPQTQAYQPAAPTQPNLFRTPGPGSAPPMAAPADTPFVREAVESARRAFGPRFDAAKEAAVRQNAIQLERQGFKQ